MTTVNWREMFEQLFRDLEDARRELGDLNGYFLKWSETGKTATQVSPKDRTAVEYIEAYEAQEVLDDLADEWRPKLYSAQIVADRERVPA